MKLIACHINNFGKLSDLNINFNDGVNVINQPNGWGKSTLAAFLKKMREGVELKELGVTTRPCQVEAAGAKTFRIILTQGLNRQIRRMCGELGYRVVTLKRVRIMNIHLGKLNTGDFRRVTPKELEELEWQLLKAREEREAAELSGGEEA